MAPNKVFCACSECSAQTGESGDWVDKRTRDAHSYKNPRPSASTTSGSSSKSGHQTRKLTDISAPLPFHQRNYVNESQASLSNLINLIQDARIERVENENARLKIAQTKSNPHLQFQNLDPTVDRGEDSN